MSLKNPHQTTGYHLGDLVIVVTANGRHANETGMRLWFECEVATIVGVDKARRVKAVLFARDWRVERRADLANLVALVPYPSAQIDVPLAMMAAREHGQPFGSLEEVRAAVRPFVLVDLAERGYDPAVGEQGSTDVDADAPATQTFAIGDWVMVSDRDRRDYGRHGNVICFTNDPARVVVEFGDAGEAIVIHESSLERGVPVAASNAADDYAANLASVVQGLRAFEAYRAEEQAARDAEAAGPTVADMRQIFGEPVEGRDYHVMPSRDAESEA